MSKYDVALRVGAETAALRRGLADARGGIRGFASQAKAELQGIKNAFGSVQAKLAAVGLGVGAFKIAQQSASVDRSLIRIKQTAGATAEDIKTLRKEIFLMSAATGNPVESLVDGFNSLVQSGQNFSQARQTIQGINVAMAVTGAQAQTLSNGLTTAAVAFDFDLTKPGMALKLLDQMTVAGRQGNAELENLSDIFAAIGVNSKSAGLSFQGSLAFVEALSLMEKDPGRLATLADATLRIFTNFKQMRKIGRRTGVQFFDAEGERRDAFAVLEDIRGKYQALTSEEQRASFIGKVFEGADVRTLRGLRTLLEGRTLESARRFTAEIEKAGGTLNRDLGEALRNSIDQAARLKNVLRQAGDLVARPINRAIAAMVEQGLKPQEQGGVGLTGGQIIGGGIAMGLSAYLVGSLLRRKGMPLFGNLLGGAGGTASGIAQGKAIEAATGVIPVFVTNWPGGGLGGAFAGVPGLPGGGFGAGGGVRPWEFLGGAGGAAGGMSKIPWYRFGGLGAGSGGVLSKMVGVAGPVAAAAAITYQLEHLVSGLTNMISGGKYENYADAIVDLFSGGKIWKAASLQNRTEVNVNLMGVDARVSADTTSTDGDSKTKINNLKHGYQ